MREYTLEELDRLARGRFLLGLAAVPLVLGGLVGGVAFFVGGGADKLAAKVSDVERYRQTRAEWL